MTVWTSRAPFSLRLAPRRARTFVRAAGSRSLRGIPFRSLGMKCQSNRSRLLKSTSAFARSFSFSESKRSVAAARILAPGGAAGGEAVPSPPARNATARRKIPLPAKSFSFMGGTPSLGGGHYTGVAEGNVLLVRLEEGVACIRGSQLQVQ